MPAIYLINPKPDFLVYMGSEVSKEFSKHPLTFIADATISTVAAMVPSDFDIKLCDESIDEIDYNTTAEYIGLTGKFSQLERIKELYKIFKAKNKTILMGGPLASLNPELVRHYCDILVIGELESVAEKLFSDLRSHTWTHTYNGEKLKTLISPTPRWDLYSNQYALAGAVQTSRGCPYNCEFCDVVKYAGRIKRCKPIASVMKELDVLYEHGYRYIFLSDDNFTANPKYAKKLLSTIRDWNRQLPLGRVFFITQLSIESVRDDELLQLCADSGLLEVFIGIESPVSNTLAEMNKVQNMHLDIKQSIQKFLNHGIAVSAGLVVGFDSDTVQTFDDLYAFAMSVPISIFTVFSLMAPVSTRLYERLRLENRVDAMAELTHVPWTSNIIPKNMSKSDLAWGTHDLINRLYTPQAFATRTVNFINNVVPNEDLIHFGKSKKVERTLFSLLKYWSKSGADEKEAYDKIFNAIRETKKQKQISQYVYQILANYLQTRYLLKCYPCLPKLIPSECLEYVI